jgi:hypothetical protein
MLSVRIMTNFWLSLIKEMGVIFKWRVLVKFTN